VREVREHLVRHQHTHRNLLWYAPSQGIFGGAFIDTRRRHPRLDPVAVRVMSDFQRR
jgi:hypothetical protein